MKTGYGSRHQRWQEGCPVHRRRRCQWKSMKQLGLLVVPAQRLAERVETRRRWR
jgi:hypothetical protein